MHLVELGFEVGNRDCLALTLQLQQLSDQGIDPGAGLEIGWHPVEVTLLASQRGLPLFVEGLDRQRVGIEHLQRIAQPIAITVPVEGRGPLQSVQLGLIT